MLANEDQRTVRDTRGLIRRWLWYGLARLPGRAHSLAIRINRRSDWFVHHMTVAKLANTVSALGHFALGGESSSGWPVFVVIDISPLCNLHCTVCLHAEPHGNPALEKQRFHAGQRMSIDQFRALIGEIEGHSLAVLLYYVGDPLMHPDLETLCAIAEAAGLNTHVCTNLSFVLSDERIRRLVTSGLTHLTVCVDGLSQAKYQMTRVGGRVDLVLSNLQRVCALRRALGRHYPRVEVQYVKYRHNLDELEEAYRRFRALGVDQVHELWGWLHNYTDRDPGRFTVRGPHRNRRLPQCHWPHLLTLVKYDGGVIPCCAFRLGEQYTATDNPRVVGNVFQTGLHAVWNSPAYRQLRRFVSHPQAYGSEPALAQTFCDQCPRLFDSDYQQQTCRFGDEFAFEDLYTLGADGRPVRGARAGCYPQTDPRPAETRGEH